MYSNNASFAASNLNQQLFPNRTYTILQSAVQLIATDNAAIDGKFVVRLYS